MGREYLESLNKTQLIEIIIKYEGDKKRFEDEVNTLRKEIVQSKFNESMYEEYLDMKESLEIERQGNIFNISRIKELEELLDRYKNIVDKLGGSREF